MSICRQDIDGPYRSKLHDRFSSHRRLLALTCSLSGVHRVLDVGCGPGHVGGALAALGYSVVGVDPDADPSSLRALGYKEVYRLDIEQEELPPVTAFDLIIFGDILEHLRDPDRVLNRTRSWLAPGGRILISVPNVAHWTVRLILLTGRFPTYNRGILDRSHLRFFTLDSAKRLVEAAGFQIKHVEVTPIPLPLLCGATGEGRPLAILQSMNAVITRCWKRLLGYQILILASLNRGVSPESNTES